MRRRRRFRKKPEVQRRDEPALIECHGKPGDDPVEVSIGSETYVFVPDPVGRKIAQVFVEDHIQCFLARPEMYRPARRSI